MSNSGDSDAQGENRLAQTVTPCCVCTCDSPAAGIGPHSRQPKCTNHLIEDTEHVRRLQRELHDKLESLPTDDLQSLRQRVNDTSADLRTVQQAFASARESINKWESRVVRQLTEKLDSTQTLLADCEDIGEFRREESETEASGDMQKLCQLTLSMLWSVDTLKDDFERERVARAAVRETSVMSVMQLQSAIDQLASDSAATVINMRQSKVERELPVVPPKCEALRAELKEQFEKVKQLNLTALVKGDTWAVVSSRWVKLWKEYVGGESFYVSKLGDENYHPGPIDNADILEPDGRLKEGTLAEINYFFMHKDAWELLANYYKTKQPEPIFRKVIEKGKFTRTLEIEVYLLDLKLAELASPDKTICQKFSRACLFSDVEATMKSLFKVPEDRETRLWVSLSGTSYDLLTDKDQTLENQVYNNQYLLLEVKGADGQWQRGESKSFSRFDGKITAAKTSSKTANSNTKLRAQLKLKKGHYNLI